MSKSLDSVLNVREQEWDIPHLMRRYGVGRNVVTGTCFAYDIPREKIGGKYIFLRSQVVLWEMTQRSIPFGRKGRLVLPAFREYSEKLHEEIRQAKKNRDWAKVEQLREEGQTYGIRCEGRLDKCGDRSSVRSCFNSCFARNIKGLSHLCP